MVACMVAALMRYCTPWQGSGTLIGKLQCRTTPCLPSEVKVSGCSWLKGVPQHTVSVHDRQPGKLHSCNRADVRHNHNSVHAQTNDHVKT
jgi:hypothetical protein